MCLRVHLWMLLGVQIGDVPDHRLIRNIELMNTSATPVVVHTRVKPGGGSRE